jgi:hypothetical protein
LKRAEQDKIDYETAKIAYESDSAARARGETVAERPHAAVQPHIEAPLSLQAKSPTFDTTSQSFELAGFGDIVSGLPEPTGEWSELHDIMDKVKPEKETLDAIFSVE